MNQTAPTLPGTARSWRDLARCRTSRADPELFVPNEATEGRKRLAARVAAAQTYCQRCPVTARCGLFAVGNGYSGVFGGELYKEGRPAPAGSAGGRTTPPPAEGAARAAELAALGRSHPWPVAWREYRERCRQLAA